MLVYACNVNKILLGLVCRLKRQRELLIDDSESCPQTVCGSGKLVKLIQITTVREVTVHKTLMLQCA